MTQYQFAPLALSMGCPAGIGPEILCKVFSQGNRVTQTSQRSPCVVVGRAAVLRQAAEQFGLPLRIVPWLPGGPVPLTANGTMPVFEVDCSDFVEPIPKVIPWGRPSVATARLMVRSIEATVRLIEAGHCSALVTCPISKENLQAAGAPYPGHTEMLAALTKTKHVRMMMAGPRLKVVLATIHVPLRHVPNLLSSQEIASCISMTREALSRDFGLPAPRIAVAGLNPHGGENGLFGDEEARIISPALAQSSGPGTVSGPWPPDTVFYQAASGAYDAVIAMYHDQGLIPFKLLHFQDGVNVTLGLPIVRTSVDHGTAYDIAGHNLADTSSLLAALHLARQIVSNRDNNREPLQ